MNMWIDLVPTSDYTCFKKKKFSDLIFGNVF